MPGGSDPPPPPTIAEGLSTTATRLALADQSEGSGILTPPCSPKTLLPSCPVPQCSQFSRHSQHLLLACPTSHRQAEMRGAGVWGGVASDRRWGLTKLTEGTAPSLSHSLAYVLLLPALLHLHSLRRPCSLVVLRPPLTAGPRGRL